MNPRNDALRIFSEALGVCNIPAAFARRFHLNTAEYKRIYVIAIGKAALPMLAALQRGLSRGAIVGGVCSATTLPDDPISGMEYFTGGHPLPNEDSFRAARAALALLPTLNVRDLVVFLISGGGSAMCELPLDGRITLDDTRALYRSLIGSGATIAEVNNVRKHFSAVKGGRLAATAGSAARVTLLVSDVAPSALDALASGPTMENNATVADCRAVLARYQLYEPMAPAVSRFFADPLLPETPRITVAPVEILLSSEHLLAAARAAAERVGYFAEIDTTCDDWDYAAAARYLLGRFRRLQRVHARVCLISGGEVTVRLSREHGAGGRNQQFALACAVAGLDGSDVVFSAGSDGIDGQSPAAGAIADAHTIKRAAALGIDAAASLEAFDAYPLFTALGDALHTGPTHNNLRDLRLLLSV